MRQLIRTIRSTVLVAFHMDAVTHVVIWAVSGSRRA